MSVATKGQQGTWSFAGIVGTLALTLRELEGEEPDDLTSVLESLLHLEG